MMWAILAAILLGLGPRTATAVSLQDTFSYLYPTFGNNSTTIVDILSGPVPDQMNRGGTGLQWCAQSGEYQFKMTIEDGTGVAV